MSRKHEDETPAVAPENDELSGEELESVAGGGIIQIMPLPEPIVPIDTQPAPLPMPGPIFLPLK